MGKGQKVKAEVFAGICGYTTIIEASRDGNRQVSLKIESDCEYVQNLAGELCQVDPFREIGSLNDTPAVLHLTQRCNLHTACLVPRGVIKAVRSGGGISFAC